MLGMPTIGELLKLAREAKGLTQDALAAETSISQGAISRIEKGITEDPGVMLLSKLAAALDQPLLAVLPELETSKAPAASSMQPTPYPASLLKAVLAHNQILEKTIELLVTLAVASGLPEAERAARDLQKLRVVK